MSEIVINLNGWGLKLLPIHLEWFKAHPELGYNEIHEYSFEYDRSNPDLIRCIREVRDVHKDIRIQAKQMADRNNTFRKAIPLTPECYQFEKDKFAKFTARLKSLLPFNLPDFVLENGLQTKQSLFEFVDDCYTYRCSLNFNQNVKTEIERISKDETLVQLYEILHSDYKQYVAEYSNALATMISYQQELEAFIEVHHLNPAKDYAFDDGFAINSFNSTYNQAIVERIEAEYNMECVRLTPCVKRTTIEDLMKNQDVNGMIALLQGVQPHIIID